MPDADNPKAGITAIFDQIAEGYDNPSQRFFHFAADYMLNLAQPAPGNRVLDIATGTGMAAIAAARLIQPGGRVQAIDIAEQMLHKAQRNVAKHALANIDLHVMDAEELEFRSNDFDLISCAFGLFFFRDVQQAVRDWQRVLKPGGRVIFSTFGKTAFQPMAQWFREALEACGADFPREAWQRFSEEAECQALLAQAGYDNIRISRKQLGYHLASENDWWEIINNSAMRGLLNLLDDTQQDSLRAEHLQRVAGLKSNDGIWLDVEVIFSEGSKPL